MNGWTAFPLRREESLLLLCASVCVGLLSW